MPTLANADRKVRAITGAVVCSIALMNSAAAQQATLPPLEVTAQKAKRTVKQKQAPRPQAKAATPALPASELTAAPTVGEELARASAPFMRVPTGVSVITGREAEERGLATARDLAQSVPNVTGFDAGGNRMTTFSIRGVRELGYQSSPGVVPGVGYYVDDVPALTTLSRASMFTRVDQIDLLKGPQSTLFGFSRPAGVIDIRTTGPSSSPTGYLSASVGNYKASRWVPASRRLSARSRCS